jgi:hypothetical protein
MKRDKVSLRIYRVAMGIVQRNKCPILTGIKKLGRKRLLRAIVTDQIIARLLA